jgi:hypothetical protein
MVSFSKCTKDGVKYWCDSEATSQSDPNEDKSLDDMGMGCRGCKKFKFFEEFDDSVRRRFGWAEAEVLCLTCLGTPKDKKEELFFHCYGILCQGQSRPANHFIDAMLTERRAKATLSDLHCARCWVRSPDCKERQKAAERQKRCASCKSQKPVMDFGPAFVKQWLRKISKGGCWRCYECQYPACSTASCGKRPDHAIHHHAAIEGEYYCLKCKYAACAGCGELRGKARAPDRFQAYICSKCRSTGQKAGTMAKVVPAGASGSALTVSLVQKTSESPAKSIEESPEISEASASSAQFSHNSKRQCPQCLRPHFRKHWCSEEDFDNNTGYCENCGMTCSVCTLTKVKEAYDKKHWQNVQNIVENDDRQPRCQECASKEKTKKFECGRCVIDGEKQCFDKSHFHPKDLDNCKQRQTWEKLRCRLP